MKNTSTLISAVAATGALAFGVAGAVGQAPAANTRAARPDAAFSMVRSTGAVTTGCLPHARARVTITKLGNAERMHVTASGLLPRSEYDLFVIQTPDAPFGLSWYQGDLHANKHGEASGTFVGRFSEETFTVAPGSAPAPVVHQSPIRDASSNPATAPVHQYHLGLWFNNPKRAERAGCGSAVTPFNGEHDAGVQILSTRQFPVTNGPLHQVTN